MFNRPRQFLQSGAAGSILMATARLRLRPAMTGDFPFWSSVRARNYDFLKPYEPAWPEGCLGRDFFSRRVSRLNRDWLEDRTYAFLIWNDDQSRLLGGININNVVRGAAQYASLGYWLDQEATGQGYMTEAAEAVLDFAFHTIDLARMNAGTLPHNEKSMAMLKRLGFSEEGYAKAYIQIDGVRQDHVLFGLNREDFVYSGPPADS